MPQPIRHPVFGIYLLYQNGSVNPELADDARRRGLQITV